MKEKKPTSGVPGNGASERDTRGGSVHSNDDEFTHDGRSSKTAGRLQFESVHFGSSSDQRDHLTILNVRNRYQLGKLW